MKNGPRADAIVIGAGIVGAAVAEALASEGMSVLVVDEQFPSAGTTAAGMGHIVAMDDSPAQLALTTLSIELFNAMFDSQSASASFEFDRCGTLWVAEDETQLDAAREKVARLMSAGVAAELIDGAALREAEPELREGLAGAVHVPGDAVVYPPALCSVLLERARAVAGARSASGGMRALGSVNVLRGVSVLRIERGSASSSPSILTTTGRVEAQFIINAAGVHAPRITPELPVVPKRGHLVITERHPGFCRHQLVELGYMTSAHGHSSESVAFNVQPRGTGQVLIGSSREFVGLDTTINRSIVERMLIRAAAFMPRIGRLLALRTWIGFRPATPDNLPLIGPWEPVPGLWIAAGHEGLGITTAPGTARVLADLMLGRTPPIDPAPYAPIRPVATVHA